MQMPERVTQSRSGDVGESYIPGGDNMLNQSQLLDWID